MRSRTNAGTQTLILAANTCVCAYLISDENTTEKNTRRQVTSTLPRYIYTVILQIFEYHITRITMIIIMYTAIFLFTRSYRSSSKVYINLRGSQIALGKLETAFTSYCITYCYFIFSSFSRVPTYCPLETTQGSKPQSKNIPNPLECDTLVNFVDCNRYVLFDFFRRHKHVARAPRPR